MTLSNLKIREILQEDFEEFSESNLVRPIAIQQNVLMITVHFWTIWFVI